MICGMFNLVCSWCLGTPTRFCGDVQFCEKCWALYVYEMRKAEWRKKAA
jgi:hypothetical protein